MDIKKKLKKKKRACDKELEGKKAFKRFAKRKIILDKKKIKLFSKELLCPKANEQMEYDTGNDKNQINKLFNFKRFDLGQNK
ncbi:hypothetical protein Mgra_00000942 [Meloidogyne graminicola]|uniref:Uncharacterized protein n=1 Tax=Meloidogyne graminicola TaxID=189291 RepID=A0A8T0A1A1_9BILA|nr:hypothetical protein Mgra_00000942 [Meloidogyne graminicola]